VERSAGFATSSPRTALTHTRKSIRFGFDEQELVRQDFRIDKI